MSSAERQNDLSEPHRRVLLEVAARVIEHGVRTGSMLELDGNGYPPELRESRGTFVTLHRRDDLLGCIGTIVPQRPMVLDVAKNAYAAVFYDPRCPKLRPDDCRHLQIHISLLSPLEPVRFTSEADLVRQLRPRIDGLLLEDGIARGTFLPSVWESLSDPRTFLDHLKMKAGLPTTYWSESLRIHRYTVESIGNEPDGD